LGLNGGYFESKSKIIFHQFDLNHLFLNPESEAQTLSKLPKFDVICNCEVLEHLYTGPNKSLEFLSKILNPNGVIFIQTPNAVSLRHRILILLGKNPYPLLRPDPNEPGHYREYTLNELKYFIEKADLKLKKAQFYNYFNYFGSKKNKIYKFITRFFPASFRDGIMLEVSKND
jgi:2-polyprenyl-3-methyl-5-hydroxy-6-metoxy-1,4-benzoquinol methylase